MEYWTVGDAAKAWNITERRVRLLCQTGRIDGAIRNGWSWILPKQSKPGDARSLRHHKNRTLHIGFQSFMELDECKNSVASKPLPCDEVVMDMALIACHMQHVRVTVDEITAMRNGSMQTQFSLAEHIAVLNTIEVINWICESVASKDRICEFTMQRMRNMLAHHRPYHEALAYRTSPSQDLELSPSERVVDVNHRIEILFSQFEGDWRWLHPVASATFLFVELMRIRPYQDDNAAIAFLMACMHLVRSGYPMPLITPDALEALYDAVKFSFRRGDCRQVGEIFTASIAASYTKYYQVEVTLHTFELAESLGHLFD
ncbi:MAG: hypothetical protein PHH80_05840 [Sphaerochaetaceae bacterium]|nr:hypothetical protein [Sphaerochaetaceae bacterium]